MLNQSFSARTISRVVKREDIPRFTLWRDPEERDEVIADIADSINAPGYEFPRFNEKKSGTKVTFSAPEAVSALLLRKLSSDLASLYRVRQANRDVLIHQIKSLLRESCAFTVLRTDIESCYESIDRDELMNWIHRDGLLAPRSLKLMRKLFSTPQFVNRKGLPRGLAVSAPLAELFLRRLDTRMRHLPHVYFYGRYVDDIIVFSWAKPEQCKIETREAVESVGLRINPRKFDSLEASRDKNSSEDCPWLNFDFLGYGLSFREAVRDRGDWRDVKIDMADAKVRKVKSRIARAFAEFSQTPRRRKPPAYHLLKKRLLFLAGNYILRKGENGNLWAGMYYSYHHLSNGQCNALIELDKFLRTLAFSKRGSIGHRLNGLLSVAERKEIAKISFSEGFRERRALVFDREEMVRITACWMYEKN